MAAITGVQQIGTYPNAGATTGVLTAARANITTLLNLVPNPDVPPAQGGGGFLDEMSPAAAAQLRVELTAIHTAMA